jgi:hypothetical protein
MSDPQNSVSTPPPLVFALDRYLVRRKVLKLLGGAFHIYGSDGALVGYSKMKAFKLREDIRLYRDESMREEILTIRARQIIDFSAAYDVSAADGVKLGCLRRRGMKSLFRDEWIVCDASDREVGRICEDNLALALVRRFLTNLVPQSYRVTLGDVPVAEFKQNFNPFVLKMSVDFSADRERRLDRRLGVAAAVLLCAIEGRQG